MSAHIPEYRRAINGRTHAQEWQPCAVEHYRVSWLRRAMVWAGNALLASAIGVSLASILWFNL
jgi:hypothetical protein